MSIRIITIDTEREVNFEIFDDEEYICRLVPCLTGFELSPLDKALGVSIEPKFLEQIIRLIIDREM